MIPWRRLPALPIAASVLLASPQVAFACAVCSDPNDPRAKAYFDMTIFMSLFPLFALGVIGVWLWRRVQAAEALSR